MTRASILAAVALAALAILEAAPQSPAPGAPAAAPAEAEKVVRAWFDRWNKLDGSPASVQALVELYEPDALQTTGPASHQLGAVSYRGHEGIRKMVADFTAAFERPVYRIESVTAREKTAQLINVTTGPWGGESAAVEYAAVHTRKQDGKRLTYPGAAFFQIENGKIRRMRLYMATGELAEVEAEAPRKKRP